MYPRIISKVCREFWCVRDETHDAILNALSSRVDGAPRAKVWDDSNDTAEPEHDAHRDYSEVGDVAIIPVCGVLGKHLSGFEMSCGGASMDRIASLLDVAGRSPRLRNVLMNFDTPGGTYVGTPELARKIRETAALMRAKGGKLVGFTDSECCSGGIWLASQCDEFFCTESSVIGSVGVRMILLDATKAYEMEGLKVNPIVSGKFKVAGADFKPLTDEEREMFQAQSDRIHSEFKTAVTLHRKVADEDLQAQVYYGAEGTQKGYTDGLVDDIDAVLAMLTPAQL